MKTILLFLCIFSFLFTNAQTADAPSLPKKLIRISTPVLHVTDHDSNIIVLKMEFNGAIPKSRLAKVKIQDIESISLVYSRFKLSDMFDQLTLNAQRMDKLYALMPQLRDNKAIQWYWVEQTGCDNPETCNDYFHGFVIRLKSESSIFTMKTEEELMEYYTKVYEGITDTKKMDSLMLVSKGKIIKTCDTIRMRILSKANRMSRIRKWDTEKNKKLSRLLKEELNDSGIVHVDLLMDLNGKLASIQNASEFSRSAKLSKLLNENLSVVPARYMNKKITTRVLLTVERHGEDVKVTLMQEPVLPGNVPFNLDKFLYQESVKVVCDYMDTSVTEKRKNVSLRTTPDIILRVFDRNKQWKNCLIATDVTGSMYPYLAQFKIWHKTHLAANSGNHDFVFFNDGDNMPDFMKVTGKVGGIYYINTSTYDSLSKLLNKSMSSGGGGDGPENNIEAVIEGLKRNPRCKEVIMIADNYATPRDLSLLEKINVPIRLVLCGAQISINTAYLDMIRRNKGSIHTMEQDLYDLSGMKDGQTIELDGLKYELKNGQFVLIPASVVVH